jgi:hypothetical protein
MSASSLPLLVHVVAHTAAPPSLAEASLAQSWGSRAPREGTPALRKAVRERDSAVVDSVVPDLVGEVAAEEAPHLFVPGSLR